MVESYPASIETGLLFHPSPLLSITDLGKVQILT